MKNLIVNRLPLVAAGLLGLLPVAFTSGAADAAASAPPLAYGVPEVIQLSQAQVGDSTIVAYIKNSGNSYGLNASQIIYLRQQGVSDGVIGAMLSQPKAGTTPVAYSTAPAPEPVTVVQPTSVTYVQPETTYVPASTVYVIPDTETYRYYNYYHPYPYYTGFYSPFSVSIGFGGRWGGGWHGGHGGWHH